MVAAVLVPFVGFAIFVDTQMAQRLSKQVVLSSLEGLADDLAHRIDRDIADRRGDLWQWTRSPSVREALWEPEIDSALYEEPSRWGPETMLRWREGTLQSSKRHKRRREITTWLDQGVTQERAYDLILLIGAQGRLVTCNSIQPDGAPMPAERIRALFERDYSEEEWFRRCLDEGTIAEDQHVSDLLPPRNAEPGVHPENYHLAFGGAVHDLYEPDRVIGVVYTLVNWLHVHERVREGLIISIFRGLVGPQKPPSAYAWIWASDADTIRAHPTLKIGQRVSQPPVELPQLVAAASSAEAGLYPEYEFHGKRKNAAFHRCRSQPEGFGWVAGVGIDNDDIYQAVGELRGLLYRASGIVALIVVLWTMIIARRTTGPILALRDHTRRVAAGDLDARIEIRTGDELQKLGEDFNRMSAELKANREQLVRAEKDAAWREMARQVAHDIKNPLTPIKLSADLLKRAREESSPQFDEIFDRTLATISRQVEHLREIASDFHALTGAMRHRPESFDLERAVREVLEFNAAWAEASGIAVKLEGRGGRVHLDRGLLRRVLLNLVSNAFEAMPDGGELGVSLQVRDGRVRLEVRDTGSGLSEEVRAHLFEPYFTTRSQGTGLGLAIARRAIEEMGGEIEVVPAPEGGPPGTAARLWLPLE